MTTDLAAVTQHVQEVLVRTANGVTLQPDGFSIQQGSTRIFIKLWASRDEEVTFIGLTVPLLTGLTATPELHEHVAFHANDLLFGHLSLERYDDGDLGLIMSHVLVGDGIADAALERAVFGMMASGDDLDDELQKQFGGHRFHEPA